MPKPKFSQRLVRPRPSAALNAIYRRAPVDPKTAEKTRDAMRTAITRVFMGTAEDRDVSVVGTYLIYGVVLAKHFDGVTEAQFRRAVINLIHAKHDLVRTHETDRGRLSSVTDELMLAVDMVLALTGGELDGLHAYVAKHGQSILDELEAQARREAAEGHQTSDISPIQEDRV